MTQSSSTRRHFYSPYYAWTLVSILHCLLLGKDDAPRSKYQGCIHVSTQEDDCIFRGYRIIVLPEVGHLGIYSADLQSVVPGSLNKSFSTMMIPSLPWVRLMDPAGLCFHVIWYLIIERFQFVIHSLPPDPDTPLSLTTLSIIRYTTSLSRFTNSHGPVQGLFNFKHLPLLIFLSNQRTRSPSLLTLTRCPKSPVTVWPALQLGGVFRVFPLLVGSLGGSIKC